MQRGLLDSTLVIWGGEFGRTAYSQGRITPGNFGRDHHPVSYSVWMAGGGIKGGQVIGKTDDGFEPGEAVPAELLLKCGELIDPAAVESMPIATDYEAAKLTEQFTFDGWRARIVDHGGKDSAKAVVGTDEVAH